MKDFIILIHRSFPLRRCLHYRFGKHASRNTDMSWNIFSKVCYFCISSRPQLTFEVDKNISALSTLLVFHEDPMIKIYKRILRISKYNFNIRSEDHVSVLPFLGFNSPVTETPPTCPSKSFLISSLHVAAQ